MKYYNMNTDVEPDTPISNDNLAPDKDDLPSPKINCTNPVCLKQSIKLKDRLVNYEQNSYVMSKKEGEMVAAIHKYRERATRLDLNVTKMQLEASEKQQRLDFLENNNEQLEAQLAGRSTHDQRQIDLEAQNGQLETLLADAKVHTEALEQALAEERHKVHNLRLEHDRMISSRVTHERFEHDDAKVTHETLDSIDRRVKAYVESLQSKMKELRGALCHTEDIGTNLRGELRRIEDAAKRMRTDLCKIEDDSTNFDVDITGDGRAKCRHPQTSEVLEAEAPVRASKR